MSDYLFAQPSFLSGLARMFDFAGALNEYNYARTPAEADAMAFAIDGAALSQDYRAALEDLLGTYPQLRAAA